MLVPSRVGLANMFDPRGRPREPPTSATRMSLAMWACDLAWQKWVRSEGSCQCLNNWWWIQTGEYNWKGDLCVVFAHPEVWGILLLGLRIC